MPYKYIGRKTDFKGKTLWEIVGNLKNFGIGRIVARNTFERYPEPSYFKILKVEPLPCPEVQNLDNLRKVRVLVEKTFRGKTFAKPITIESVSYKSDYKLIPKDEEEQYCRQNKVDLVVPVYPRTTQFPPLLRELLIRDMKTKGENIREPELEIVYNKNNNHGKYRIAEKGEEATVTFDTGINNTKIKSLYSNIKVT